MAMAKEKQDTPKIDENSEKKEDEVSGESQEKELDKQALIKKVLIGSIAFLSVFLIVIVLIFIFKSPNEAVVEEVPAVAPQAEEKVDQIEEPEPVHKEFKFDFNNLDPEKLNEQLSLLTNKNLEIQMQEELDAKDKKSASLKIDENIVLAEPEIKQEIKAAEENIEKSIEEIKKDLVEVKSDIKEEKKEEATSKLADAKVSNPPLDNNTIPGIEKPINNSLENSENKTIKKDNLIEFSKLINVAKIKGNLQKKFLDKAVAIDSNILLCRDDKNNIELYYGPFNDDSLRDILLNKLLKAGFKEAYTLEMSKDEFDKRCNY